VKSKPGAGTTIRARAPLKTDRYREMAGWGTPWICATTWIAEC